jgi:YidC/Oxa1 family membrane protein insertase
MHLDFLYTAVSWVLLRWYQLFTFLGMGKGSGLTWALSIVMLVVTARLLMFRFFVKQVHYQRRMQEMQPKIKKLQDKHKGDRATLQREMMALQQAEGFNPISGCLPMFLQIPVFIALFHVLKHMSNSVNLSPGNPKLRLYGFTQSQTLDAAKAKLFHAPLAASLHETSQKIHDLGGHVATTRTVTLVLVLVSAAATLITQRAVIANQTTPAEGQAAMIQKLMMVGIPISVVFSGFIFPLGVLLYWFTSNLWTMFQQFYILKYHPHTPGGTVDAVSPAAPSARPSAPKVGQKPVHPKSTRPTVTPNTTSDKISLAKDGGSSNGRAESNGTVEDGNPAATRPASRPNRPTGNRPGNKRAPSKKRR